MFSCEYRKILKSMYSEEHLQFKSKTIQLSYGKKLFVDVRYL